MPVPTLALAVDERPFHIVRADRGKQFVLMYTGVWISVYAAIPVFTNASLSPLVGMYSENIVFPPAESRTCDTAAITACQLEIDNLNGSRNTVFNSHPNALFITMKMYGDAFQVSRTTSKL